jgi:hypothetical protein
MKKSTYIILLQLLFSVCIFAQLPSSGQESNKIRLIDQKYFERDKNIKLVFDSDFGETKLRFEEVEQGYKLINESDDFRYAQTLIEKEEGIFLMKTEQKIKIFLFIKSSAEYVYPTPVLQLPRGKPIGEKWIWDGLQIMDDDTATVRISGIIYGEEVIKLPAGEFEVIKVGFDIKTSSGENTSLTQWIAPKLGTIKLHAEIDEPGLVGIALDLLGYDEINFELKEVIY